MDLYSLFKKDLVPPDFLEKWREKNEADPIPLAKKAFYAPMKICVGSGLLGLSVPLFHFGGTVLFGLRDGEVLSMIPFALLGFAWLRHLPSLMKNYPAVDRCLSDLKDSPGWPLIVRGQSPFVEAAVNIMKEQKRFQQYEVDSFKAVLMKQKLLKMREKALKNGEDVPSIKTIFAQAAVDPRYVRFCRQLQRTEEELRQVR